MTTPQAEQHPTDPPPPAVPGPDGDAGDQDIDAAGTEADPLPGATPAPGLALTTYLLAELDREVDRTRRALERLPDDRADWKPHARSMDFGTLSHLVATMPSWIAMVVDKDELDVVPQDDPSMARDPVPARALMQALDGAAADARTALMGTTDGHLQTEWRLLARANVVQRAPRFQMIQDTFNHWAHHRGQLTVYLRLLDAHVPAIYGPSADEMSFR